MTRQVRTFPGAAYNLGYHVVWCPKYRRPVLGGRVKGRFGELICAKADERGRQVVAFEVMSDQVRLFVRPRPKNSPSYVASRFTGFASHRLRAEFAHLRSQLPTLWSRSSFVATVGAVSADTVRRYIETQYERLPKGGGARA
ncbi:IS200/IS605 family transposase [Streptosporangium sp. NPDC023825]|uniref:IS200/IS605 family transposase n=1 Tax=Streptosporangium sp. NPDC023825 TaxID=3154909 RepID=UPI0034392C1B